MLKVAVETVQRNIRPLLLFLAITTVFFTLRLVLEKNFESLTDEETQGFQATAYIFGASIISVIVTAIAKSLAFSNFGREIEKPFWKIRTNKEAFIRFFPMWMFFGLASLLFFRGIAGLPSDSSDLFPLLMIWLVFNATLTPIGATIMFYEKCGSEEIKLALSTFGHQLPRFFMICFFAFILNLLLFSLLSSIEFYFHPILIIIEGYFKCVIFVYSWFICRAHREILEQSDDDFDF